MNKLPFFIAWRYMLGTSREKNIASMVRICFISIFIGAFSLALAVAIMNGFEKATYEKMQGIHAQIIVRAHGNDLDIDKLAPILSKEFPAIESWSGSSMRQGIIQPIDSDEITNVVVIKAIDPKNEARITHFDKKMITYPESVSFEDTFLKNNIAIGAKLAQSLNLKIGDEINLLFTQDEKSRARKITLGQIKAKIGGIFSTGIDEFDAGLILTSFDFFSTMFPDVGVSQINIRLQPHANELSTIEELKKRLHLEVYSWKELYPALVAALKLEKYAAFIILALISLVAAMNIIALLFMQITQKRGDIAVLKSMGFSNKSLELLFVSMGMSLTLIASICGLALACLVSWFLETCPLITLPDVYYVSHIPARMEPHILILVFIAIMLISLLATWIPARRALSINIAQVLRFEA